MDPPRKVIGFSERSPKRASTIDNLNDLIAIELKNHIQSFIVVTSTMKGEKNFFAYSKILSRN